MVPAPIPRDLRSPGAWGVTWEDLVELKHDNVALLGHAPDMSSPGAGAAWMVSLRCGLQSAVPAWQYISPACSRNIRKPFSPRRPRRFLGSHRATAHRRRLEWAYSELFQNYSGRDVAAYLDYALRQSERVGLLSTIATHDNDRLAGQTHGRPANIGSDRPADGGAAPAARGHSCAIAWRRDERERRFGLQCGVEWRRRKKPVHDMTAWPGQSGEPASGTRATDRLLAEHPCSSTGARLTRLSGPESPGMACCDNRRGRRYSARLVNNDVEREQVFLLKRRSPDRRERFYFATRRSGDRRSGRLEIRLLGQLCLSDLYSTAKARSRCRRRGILLSPTAQARGLGRRRVRRGKSQAGGHSGD